jgi:hypothetical protein
MTTKSKETKFGAFPIKKKIKKKNLQERLAKLEAAVSSLTVKITILETTSMKDKNV